MKKVLAFLTALMTVCILASCGSSSDDKDDDSSKESSSVSEKDESSSEDESEDEESSESDDEDENESSESKLKSKSETKSESESESESDSDSSEESSEDETSEAETSGESSEADTDSDFVMGTVDENVYTSSFSGLKFTAPDGFVFSDEEEILDLMGIGIDTFMDEDKSELYKALAQQNSIYDMLAKDPATGDNIMVMYENLAAYGESTAEAIDEDTYIQVLDTQMESMLSGMTYTNNGTSDVTLGGQPFKKVDYSCTISEYNYTTSQSYYVAKNGNYMTVVILSSGALGDGDPSVYEKCFSAYSE